MDNKLHLYTYFAYTRKCQLTQGSLNISKRFRFNVTAGVSRSRSHSLWIWRLPVHVLSQHPPPCYLSRLHASAEATNRPVWFGARIRCSGSAPSRRKRQPPVANPSRQCAHSRYPDTVSHLRRGMLPWQGGGHRRRFVRRKEPLKTWDLRRIFFAARLLAGERLETRSAALTVARNEPLKQVTISLRPGPYSARGGQWRETFEFHRVEESNESVGGGGGGREQSGAGMRPGAIYDVFLPPSPSSFFRHSFSVSPGPSSLPPAALPRHRGAHAHQFLPGYRSSPMTPDGASAPPLGLVVLHRCVYVCTYIHISMCIKRVRWMQLRGRHVPDGG